MNGVTAMDENGEEIKSPIKRLGSTRKLILFNSKYITFCIIPVKKSLTRRAQYLITYYLDIPEDCIIRN